MRSIRGIVLGIGASIFLTSCALYNQTAYTEYHESPAITGHGGTMTVVDGIEVWTAGEPNQRFKVLGVISQSHYDNGGALSMLAGATKGSELINTAKKYNGDAIIFRGTNSVVAGHTTRQYPSEPATGVYPGYNGGVTFGGVDSEKQSPDDRANAHTDIQTTTSVEVIKYLDRKRMANQVRDSQPPETK